jgi:hypothetical protein
MYKNAIDQKATITQANAIVLAEIKNKSDSKQYEKEKYI